MTIRVPAVCFIWAAVSATPAVPNPAGCPSLFDPLGSKCRGPSLHGGRGVVRRFAIIQPAQTTLRSEIGKIELDRTFEERAAILQSEGTRDAAINNAEDEKQEVIKRSEADRQRQINLAEGEAQAILTVANATAEGIRRVASAIQEQGGDKAVQLRVAEQCIEQSGKLAKENNTMILPASLSDLAGMIATAMTFVNPEGSRTPGWAKGEWAHLDSNQGPADYESAALTD
jgi:hypothetical protein